MNSFPAHDAFLGAAFHIGLFVCMLTFQAYHQVIHGLPCAVQAPKTENGPMVASEKEPAGSDSVQAAAMTALRQAAALMQ